MFIFISEYKKPVPEIEKYLSDHRAFLRKYFDTGDFVFCGRRVPRTGGIILCRTAARRKAEAILSEDPFVINGIAEYQVTEFVPTGCGNDFTAIMPEGVESEV